MNMKEREKIIKMIENLEKILDETYIINKKSFRDRADVFLGFIVLKDEIRKM